LDCRGWSLAHAQKVFRGENYGDFVITACHKADWKLVPRAEEHKYLNIVKKPRPRNVVPDTVPFPPLLNHFIMLERQQKGEPLDKPPMLPIKSVLTPRQPILPQTAASE